MVEMERYIQKHGIKCLVNWSGDVNPAIIIVIPAYDEPRITEVIDSIQRCHPTTLAVEVLVVFNSGEHTSDSIRETNRHGHEILSQRYKSCGVVSVHSIIIENVRKKHAGVGFARKTGMGQAVLRFYGAANQNGLIGSLDADTLVSENYMQQLTKIYNDTKTDAGTLFFEHRIKEETDTVNSGIILYELHLRYYQNMLDWIGFPYTYYTLGSAFFVRMGTYVKQGGMNRKQGGEDFYFLHKVLPKCNYCEDIETTVYPSGRVSQRVPFGTGPRMLEYLDTREMSTYAFESFLPLKQFYQTFETLYGRDADFFLAYCRSMPYPLNRFLEVTDFAKTMEEISANASVIKTFRSRFYDNFDAFFIVKYLNFSHEQHFTRQPVLCACKKYFDQKQLYFENDPENALTLLRQLDRQRLIIK